MPNPMTTKNPFLSMWLSGANSVAGSPQGLWMAERHRQRAAMLHEMTEQMVRFWTGAWMFPTVQNNNANARTARRSRR